MGVEELNEALKYAEKEIKTALFDYCEDLERVLKKSGRTDKEVKEIINSYILGIKKGIELGQYAEQKGFKIKLGDF